MEKNVVDGLLAEIAQAMGIIHLDCEDVDKFKNASETVDAVKVGGKIGELSTLLENSISRLRADNSDKQLKRLMLQIVIPDNDALLMEHLGGIHDVIGKLDDEVEIKWGISTNDGIAGDSLELITVAGFLKKSLPEVEEKR